MQRQIINIWRVDEVGPFFDPHYVATTQREVGPGQWECIDLKKDVVHEWIVQYGSVELHKIKGTRVQMHQLPYEVREALTLALKVWGEAA